MNILLGRSANLALYGNDDVAVVLDTDLDIIVASGAPQDLISLHAWENSKFVLSAGQERLCVLAVGSQESKDFVTASGNRMYSIPDGVKSEAKKALEWRKEHKRGGTPVGIGTARRLAKGGQIGLEKVRHIAKFFPRHEKNKKAEGWSPGEDGFPSNGRIAWALWGGDAAQRWASAIVERENKAELSVQASGYAESFNAAYELEEGYGPEFMARIHMDGSGIDRVYKIESNGDVFVWDDNTWDNMGDITASVWDYDRQLDEESLADGCTHILIDIDSAMFVASKLSVMPEGKVTITEIDAEEQKLADLGMPEEDWELVDRVMSLSGNPMTAASKADKDGDGKLDADFLSEKAKNQPRDSSGVFVSVGSRTVVGNDKDRGSGVIDSIDYDNSKVNVRLDSGKMISVAGEYLTPEADFDGPSMVPSRSAPIDLSGILGEPRTPPSYKARLSGTLPALGQGEIRKMMEDWPSWVSKQKDYKLFEDKDIPERFRGKGITDIDRKYMKKRYGKDFSVQDILAAADKKVLTPETSGIVKYLAIVSPDDVQAVMDLVAIVPTSETLPKPITYRRQDKKWIEDSQVLADLMSPAPPPVVELEEKYLNEVLVEVDGLQVNNKAVTAAVMQIWFAATGEIDTAIVAAGGIDRNRGGAENLRRYWTRGKGALKIRWGTPGDWTRCVRQLSKYMGPRAKGYCQLRHKEATGVYTGSKYNAGKNKGRKASAAPLFASEEIFTQLVVEKSELIAKAKDATQKVGLVAAAAPTKNGASFYIPMLVPEEVESGDGRKFKRESISVRDLPIPLLWQIKTGSGHDGSVVVGRIDYIERIEGGMGNAYGVFDVGPYGREAERLVAHGFLRGVSVDLDQFEAKEDKPNKTENSDDGEVMGGDKLTINKARIMAATIVAKPAFQECSIALQNQGGQEEEMILEDGVYEESLADFSDVEPIVASAGFLRAEIPMSPPADWFKNPKLSKPTPLFVDENGQIYGHIAAWDVNHIGLPRATKPPRSKSKYAYFHTGVVRVEDGTDVPVGQLTLAGGHAPLNADAASAAKHYDDTASAVADIHVGEDEFGIWCAGSLRPNLEEMQIRALRASAPSGDWRPINGSLELVAICQVNVPGFPTARAMIAGGKMLALVAAGASHMALMRCSGAACALSTKAEVLGQLAASAPDLKKRVKEAKKKLREANIQSITASASKMREKALIAAAIAEMSKISDEERMSLAKEGKAMPDGSYPIRDVSDLRNAIQAYGRATRSERRAVRKHIMKRAQQLKQRNLIPEHWKQMANSEIVRKSSEMRKSIAASAKSIVAAPGDKEISEIDLKKLRDAQEKAEKQTEDEIEAAKEVRSNRGNLPTRDEDGRSKYISGVTQPRDDKGMYRKVLARLRQNLGIAGLSRALLKVQEAENLDFAGDYTKSAEASSDLLGMIDRLDDKSLNPEALENVRLSAAELGKTLANLPLPFGKDASKLRFSDLPAGLKDLIEQMMTRVEAKIGKEDAKIATERLRAFKSGADLFNQSEIQSELNVMLRLLT